MIVKILEKNGKKYIVGYHTQEYRHTGCLDEPILCKYYEAWLGHGYYFWTELEFAKFWGEDFKKGQTGYYDIYIAHIENSNLLDTVFNREGYEYFVSILELTINKIKEYDSSVTLAKVHRFLRDEVWGKEGITGIIFDDKPSNPSNKNRTYSAINPLYYKKRVQVGVFDKNIIYNFEIHLEEQS